MPTQSQATNPFTYLLSLGHLFVDFNQGAVAALLPFLIEEHHYAYAVAASLIFAMNLVSSIVQPLFGYLSDTHKISWLLPCAILVAGLGFSFLGIASTFTMLVIGVMVSGVGIAAYHPEGAKMTNQLTPKHKGASMGVFSFGGNLGFALGPVCATLLINAFGTVSVTFFLIPTVLIGTLFIVFLPRARQSMPIEPVSSDTTNHNHPNEPDDWAHFGILTLILVARSVTFYGLNTFLALYWIHVLGQSKTSGSLALSLLFVFGSIGTLIGGHLADRWGYKRTIEVTFWILPFMLLLLSFTKNIVLAFILLVPLGMLLYLPYSSIVISGQRYLPSKMGFASGVTLGLSVSIGGIASPLLGLVADHTSLTILFQVVAGVALIGALASFFLREMNPDHATNAKD